VGLLVLRAVVGLTAMVQGMGYLSDRGDLTPGAWVGALLLTASGASLLMGFLTPAVSILVGVGGLGILFSWFPAPAWTFLDSKLATSELIAMSAAIAFLGPGAFSLDSRLFGRREIVIPPSSRTARF